MMTNTNETLSVETLTVEELARLLTRQGGLRIVELPNGQRVVVGGLRAGIDELSWFASEVHDLAESNPELEGLRDQLWDLVELQQGRLEYYEHQDLKEGLEEGEE